MNQQRLKYLFGRYQADQLSEQEQVDWLKALTDPTQVKALNELAKDVFEREDLLKYEMDKTRANDVLGYVFQHPQINTRKNYMLWKRIAVAAALVVAVFGAILFYHKLWPDQRVSNQLAYKNDVAPGSVGATLTLATGEKIRLGDAKNGEIAKQAGISVTKTADGQVIYSVISKGKPDAEGRRNAYHTLSTAKGETYQVRLPDGSMVWLNAASSLTYTAALLEDGKRKVKLEGEGYFEVAKDKLHPFVVESRRQKVEVLGTHFNLSAYADEASIKTTLLEGSVKVNLALPVAGEKSTIQSTILKPSEQAVLSVANRLTVARVDVDEAIAWKNGLIMFKSERISEIMKKVQRWYDVDIVYNDGNIGALKFSGTISRYDHVSKLLDILETTGQVHFKIEGRKITVMK